MLADRDGTLTQPTATTSSDKSVAPTGAIDLVAITASFRHHERARRCCRAPG